MFCSNCGNKLQMNDQYCETCGAKRLSTVESTKSNMKQWHWLIPMIAFLLAVICLSGYLFTEHKKTHSAMEAFKKGETAALEGEYKEARKYFKEALALRSKFPAAKENMELVNSAIEIKERLHIAAKHQNDQEFNKSYEQLEKAEGILSTYSGKVADSIGTDIRNTRMNVKVTEISHEMKGKSKLEELEPILVKAEKLDLKEAEEIAEEIRDRIAEIAFAQANDLLTDHQFTAALASVKKGLYHKPKNEKLINLKSTIQNEQAAFEKAEEKRYEQALIAASKEKEHNLNDALEVTSIKAKFNDLGDLIVKGSVISKATVPITSVSISYSLMDDKKRVYDENEVYISPDVLYPDEIGTFEYTHYLIDKELNVEFNEANWYLQ